VSDEKQPPKYIIDPSFVRSASGDGRQLKVLADRGYRVVLIDNLAFELCSTANRAQWPATQLKLSCCPDSIDCWHHTSVMMRVESEKSAPYGKPLFPQSTEMMRSLLRARSPHTADDLQAIVRAEQERREGEIMPAMFRAFQLCAANSKQFSEVVAGRPLADDQLAIACNGFVNNPDNVRKLIGIGDEVFARCGIDDKWVAWHHYKAFLAVFCEYLRQQQPDFSKLAEPAKKRWINIKHDLDYLISLAFADGIASAETAGEQFHFRRWMYGNSKDFISLQSL
jgi:hypothetical protein